MMEKTGVSEETSQAETAEGTVYCTYHPNQPTVLRCNRCGQPICYKCAVLTEVGYRCKQCVRNQRAVYYTGHSYDILVAAAVAFVLSAIAGLFAFALLDRFGLFFGLILGVFTGPVVGGAIAEAARRSVGRRRSLNMNLVVAAAAIFGFLLLGLLAPVVLAPALLLRLPALLLSHIGSLVFTFMAASTIYARLQ